MSQGLKMGIFFDYEFVNNEKWLVRDKSGNQYKFGYSTSTQQYTGTSTFKWLLEEMIDTNGNYVLYEYFHDNGQVYPDVARLYWFGYR